MKNNRDSSHQGSKSSIRRLNGKESKWVCALGRHKDLWDFAITGSFDDCLDYGWGILQHEVNLHFYQFKSKLRVNGGYIGKYAEIKRLPKKFQLGSGLAIGELVVIFDDPEEIQLNLSKPIYAGLVPHFSDVIFGHHVYRGLVEDKILNQLTMWPNLKFVKNKVRDKIGLKNIELLRLSNYPIIVTSSPFILAKAYGEGLISCFVPSFISLVSNPKNGEPQGILSDLFEWLSPYPKNVYLVEENLNKMAQDDIYEETEGYKQVFRYTFALLQDQCHKLKSSVTYLPIDKKASGNQLVKMIKEKETIPPFLLFA